MLGEVYFPDRDSWLELETVSQFGWCAGHGKHYGITVCFRTLLQRLTAHLVSI